jgi:hypothetical protein
MGYSYSVKAGLAYDYVLSILRANEPLDGPSNTWHKDGKAYFEECSRRSHSCGKVTSTVYRIDPGNLAHKVGGILIEGDGTVVRWPGTTAELRKSAKDVAEFRYNERYRVKIDS